MKSKLILMSLLACLWLIPGHAADPTSELAPPQRPLPAPAAHGAESSVSPTGDIVPGTAPAPADKTLGRSIDDATITTRIKARYVRDDTVKARDIKVETSKGVVQLSGFVTSDVEKTRAAEIARAVPGVVEVRNDVIVQTANGNATR